MHMVQDCTVNVPAMRVFFGGGGGGGGRGGSDFLGVMKKVNVSERYDKGTSKSTMRACDV